MARVRVCGVCWEPLTSCVCPPDEDEPQVKDGNEEGGAASAEFPLSLLVFGDPA